MRLFFTTIFLCFLTAANGQEQLASLKAKLLQADTVLIVSHEQTGGFVLVDEKTGKELSLPELVVDGHPNRAIFHEERVIAGPALQALIKILVRPFQDKEIERMSCYMPHHAVLIVKDGKTSFIDICFGCLRLETSDDLQVNSDDFDKRKWKELKNFFVAHNMKYQLVNGSGK